MAHTLCKKIKEYVTERCDLPDGYDVSTYELFQGTPAKVLHGGESIDIGGRRIEVLHTPGHSPGHMCFWEKEKGYLYTGDLVYQMCSRNLATGNLMHQMCSCNLLRSFRGMCQCWFKPCCQTNQSKSVLSSSWSRFLRRFFDLASASDVLLKTASCSLRENCHFSRQQISCS